MREKPEPPEGLGLLAEEHGKCVLTRGQLKTLLHEYERLMGLLDKLLDERRRMEFLLVESRLRRLGISRMPEYLN